MYKLGLFSDPHIGLERRAHTTTSSRKTLTTALYNAGLSAADKLKETASEVLCLGDLFDKSHNSEVIIMQGLQVSQLCDVVLGGNHDVPNREDTVSSLEIVKEANLEIGNLVVPIVGETLFGIFNYKDVDVIAVPHQSSQELFDEVLEQVIKHEGTDDKLEIVIMHCNYECGYADNEISLNLTSEMADKLLDRFDYVFIGHEHEHRSLKDDRLIITGNTHPTSFSDISDKFVWYITEDNEVVKEKIWDMDEKFAELNMTSLDLIETCIGAEFIDVCGVLSAEDYAGVADFMVQMWKANPQAYMIRNNLKVIESESIEEVGLTEIDNLPAHITEELKDDKALQKTWEKYLEKVQ